MLPFLLAPKAGHPHCLRGCSLQMVSDPHSAVYCEIMSKCIYFFSKVTFYHYWVFTMCWDHLKGFAYTASFSPHNSPIRWVLSFFPACRWGKWDPKVKHLARCSLDEWVIDLTLEFRTGWLQIIGIWSNFLKHHFCALWLGVEVFFSHTLLCYQTPIFLASFLSSSQFRIWQDCNMVPSTPCFHLALS